MSAQTKGRAEVAADLRACAVDDLNGMSFQRRLAEIVGVPDGTWRQVMRRLADLIEVPKCTMRYDAVHMDFACSRCGTFFEYPATSLEGKTRDFNYCPNCGAEVIGDGDD